MAKFHASTTEEILAQTKTNAKVRFSFKYCKLQRNFCIKELNSNQIEKFFKKLWDKEDFTAHDFCSRKKEQWWFDVYTKNSSSYSKLKKMFFDFDLFWHFWITGIPWKPTFRAMWTRKDETIYILLIDHDWKIDEKAHK